MDWRDHIHSAPSIMAGKPVIRGTRLTVAFVLDLFSSGWTHEQVLESYPQLEPEAIHAVFGFVADAMRERSFYSAALSR